MKLIIAIVPAALTNSILDALLSGGYRVTHVSTTGGFLRRENSTLLIGVDSEHLGAALDCIRTSAQGAKARHQTLVFVLDEALEVTVLGRGLGMSR